MTQPSPPRSEQSLPRRRAAVNAFRRLVVAQGVPLLLVGGFVALAGHRDADEIVGVWATAWMLGLVPLSALLGWLAARIDRRVAQRAPVGRMMWLPAAAAGATVAWWVPMLAITPTQLVLWLVDGRSRYLDGTLIGAGAWIVVAVAAAGLLWSTRWLDARADGTRPQRVHLTDIAPTSLIGAAWAVSVAALPAGGIVAVLQSGGLGWGMAALVGWAVAVAMASVGAVAGLVRTLDPSQWPHVVREVVGASFVAGWVPVFVMTMFPTWTGHEDQRWLAILLASLAIVAGTAVWSIGRADRHDELLAPSNGSTSKR